MGFPAYGGEASQYEVHKSVPAPESPPPLYPID